MLSDKKVSRIPFNCWYSSSSWTASLEGKPWRSVGLLEIFLTETVQPVRKELTGSWPVGDNIVQKQSALSTRLTVRYRWKAGELLTVHPTFSYSLWRRFKRGMHSQVFCSLCVCLFTLPFCLWKVTLYQCSICGEYCITQLCNMHVNVFFAYQKQSLCDLFI